MCAQKLGVVGLHCFWLDLLLASCIAARGSIRRSDVGIRVFSGRIWVLLSGPQSWASKCEPGRFAILRGRLIVFAGHTPAATSGPALGAAVGKATLRLQRAGVCFCWRQLEAAAGVSMQAQALMFVFA